MYFLRWFLATLSLASLASGQTCYYPNGVAESTLKACSVASGNDVAACCFVDHYCMTNGLCLSPTEGTWYRGGCTDSGFQQSGCPKICHTNDIEGGVTNSFVGIFNCGRADNGSMLHACLERDNCLTQNFTLGAYRAVINAALSTDLSDSGATAIPSVPPSTSASTETTGAASCTATEQASNGISPGAAAGIGVGVGLPLAVAVGALTFMLMREKRRSRGAQAGHDQQDTHNQRPYYNTASPWAKPAGQYVPHAEVPGQVVQAPHELADTQGKPELGH